MVSVKDRKGRLGSSDVAAILGVSKWATPFDVWEVVTGRREPDGGNEVTEWGEKLEAAIGERWWFDRDHEVAGMVEGSEYTHPQLPYLIVHPDWVVGDNLVVEGKSTDPMFREEWEDNVPEYYVPQAVAMMACTRVDLVEFAVLIASRETRRILAALVDAGIETNILAQGIEVLTVPFERRPRLEELVLERVHEFWETYVVKDEPPPVMTLDDCTKRWRRSVHDKGKVATARVSGVVMELARAKAEAKIIEERVKGLTLEVKSFMEDADTLLGDDLKPLMTWRTGDKFNPNWVLDNHPELYSEFVETEDKFDSAAFKKAHPKLHKKAMEPGAGNRSLLSKIKLPEKD